MPDLRSERTLTSHELFLVSVYFCCPDCGGPRSPRTTVKRLDNGELQVDYDLICLWEDTTQ